MIRYDLPRARLISELRYRPVNLGGSWRPAAAGYRPLGIELPARRPEKSLGQSILQPSGLAGTLLFAGTGVAGLYVSEIFPSPESAIVKGVSFAALGWAAYSLVSMFTGSSSSVDKNANSEGPPTPVLSQSDFDLISLQVISPIPNSIPEVSSDWFVPSHFDLKIQWSSQAAHDVTFPYDIVARSVSGPGAVNDKTSVEKIIYSSSVKLPAGLKSPPLTIPIEVSSLKPPQPGTLSSEATGYFSNYPYGVQSFGPAYFNITLQIRKTGPQGPVNAVDILKYGPFVYGKF